MAGGGNGNPSAEAGATCAAIATCCGRPRAGAVWVADPLRWYLILRLIVAGGGDTYRGPLRVDTAVVSTVHNRAVSTDSGEPARF
jgi:hypothetical protein